MPWRDFEFGTISYYPLPRQPHDCSPPGNPLACLSNLNRGHKPAQPRLLISFNNLEWCEVIKAKFQLMNLKLIPKCHGLRATLVVVLSLMAGQSGLLGASLQGQNKGNTNIWTSVNLQGWVELDYIPFRVFFNSGSAGSQ